MALGTSYITSGLNTASNWAMDTGASIGSTASSLGSSAWDTATDWTVGEGRNEQATENIGQQLDDFSQESTVDTIIEEGVGSESLGLGSSTSEDNRTVFDQDKPTTTTGLFGSGGTFDEGYIEEGAEAVNQAIEPLRDAGEWLLKELASESGKDRPEVAGAERRDKKSQEVKKKRRQLNKKQRKIRQIKEKLQQELTQQKRERLRQKLRELRGQEKQLKGGLAKAGGSSPNRSRGRTGGGLGTGTKISLVAGAIGFLLFVTPESKGSKK